MEIDDLCFESLVVNSVAAEDGLELVRELVRLLLGGPALVLDLPEELLE